MNSLQICKIIRDEGFAPDTVIKTETGQRTIYEILEAAIIGAFDQIEKEKEKEKRNNA